MEKHTSTVAPVQTTEHEIISAGIGVSKASEESAASFFSNLEQRFFFVCTRVDKKGFKALLFQTPNSSKFHTCLIHMTGGSSVEGHVIRGNFAGAET
jgi:hypothetical protein